MSAVTLPRILSPNLGCPAILSLAELSGQDHPSLRLVVAAGPSGEGVTDSKPPRLWLAPIGSPREHRVKLEVLGPVSPIDDWGTLGPLRNIDDARLLFNKILHYEVLGPDTAYFEVHASLGSKEAAKLQKSRNRGSGKSPILCDLIAEFGTDSRPSNELVYPHAVQLVDTFDEGLNFIHLTDLHLARRNDELLDEILHCTQERRPKRCLNTSPDRSLEEIQASFVNYNDKFRQFIKKANDLAEEGKLHLVIITGDIVDFAYHGWEYETNYAENNWRTFINIVTGSGNERHRQFLCKDGKPVHGNPGLKVAVFTSTGNHDWRLFPYDPREYRLWGRFGLQQREIKHFEFRSYDDLRHKKKREELAPEITKRLLDQWNLGAFEGQYELKVAKWVATETAEQGVAAVSGLLGFVGADSIMSKQAVSLLMRLGLPVLVGGAVGLAAKTAFNSFVKQTVEFLMDNPLRAESMALHHYLLNVNPYLDYGFTFGKHSFILMDSGADVFTGNLLDGKDLSNLKRASIRRNVLGGSPDSKAFDSERMYYNWSQIVWLEKVLRTVGAHDGQRPCDAPQGGKAHVDGRIFVFLHAPPLNTELKDGEVAEKLWEKGEKPLPIRKKAHDLTFGTLNHYVSEFLYLCLGYLERDVLRENRQPSPMPDQKLCRVDMVFSGHAHRALEFRLKPGKHAKDDIRIYSRNYSERERDLSDDWWEKHGPVLVQTPACGLRGQSHKQPPYFRLVTVSSEGLISRFRVENLEGPAPVKVD